MTQLYRPPTQGVWRICLLDGVHLTTWTARIDARYKYLRRVDPVATLRLVHTSFPRVATEQLNCLPSDGPCPGEAHGYSTEDDAEAMNGKHPGLPPTAFCCQMVPGALLLGNRTSLGESMHAPKDIGGVQLTVSGKARTEAMSIT